MKPRAFVVFLGIFGLTGPLSAEVHPVAAAGVHVSTSSLWMVSLGTPLPPVEGLSLVRSDGAAAIAVEKAGVVTRTLTDAFLSKMPKGARVAREPLEVLGPIRGCGMRTVITVPGVIGSADRVECLYFTPFDNLQGCHIFTVLFGAVKPETRAEVMAMISSLKLDGSG